MKSNQSLHAIYFTVVVSLIISIMVSMIGVYIAVQNIKICSMDDPMVMWLAVSVFVFVLVLQYLVSILRKKDLMLSLDSDTPIKIGSKFYYLVDERVYVSAFINIANDKNESN